MVYGAEGGLQAAGIGDLVGCEVAAWPVQMPRGHLEGLHPPLQATPAASTTAFPSYAGVSGMEGGRPSFPLCMPAAPAGGCPMHFVDALQDRGRRGCCPWGDGKRRRPLLSRTRSRGQQGRPRGPAGSGAGSGRFCGPLSPRLRERAYTGWGTAPGRPPGRCACLCTRRRSQAHAYTRPLHI